MIRLDGAAFVCGQKAKIRPKVPPKRLARTHGSITFKGSQIPTTVPTNSGVIISASEYEWKRVMNNKQRKIINSEKFLA